MRNVIRLQMELGQVAIEEIEIDESSRDDIPPLLLGLRHVYADRSVRARLFEILEQGILPEVSHTKGRPGMELWRILVMGLLKQVLGCDFDRLHELVNQHHTVRKFLGHSGFWDETRYRYPTVVHNVSLLTPDVLGEVLQLIAESGHALVRKRKRKRKSGPGGRPSKEPLRGRCDSFVVKTDVHFPTDVNLLWDAMRCLVRETGRSTLRAGVSGGRQWRHRSRRLQRLFQKVRRTRRARPGPIQAYLDACWEEVRRAEATVPALREQGVGAPRILRIESYLKPARRQLDPVDRRLLKGEKIPQEEKVFSIFEEHTRWCVKGKAGVPVELGVPVAVLEDQHGFLLHSRILWEGGDVDHAVPMIREAQARFPDLRLCSFDRGFHSPSNRIALDELLDHNVLPKKGKLGPADRKRVADPTFREMRRQHPAVESAINNLEQRGMDRVLSYGAEGFARMVALSMVAFNVHRIGLLLQRQARAQARRRRRRAA